VWGESMQVLVPVLLQALEEGLENIRKWQLSEEKLPAIVGLRPISFLL